MNFWKQLATKPKPDLAALLTKKLGPPDNELNQNLFQEIIKKINSYYAEPEETNFTLYSLVGYLTEIVERKYKEGPKKGQIYYVLKLGGAGKEKLQAKKEHLPEEKWEQIKKTAILGQNLVFKYRKWITNKQVLDFYPPRREK